jgi:hypothetical protein
MEAPAATDVPEASLCRWLFGVGSSLCRVRDELRISPGSKVLFETRTADVAPSARGPGDVDVLLVDRLSPQRAIAIETKRVKVSTHAFHTGQAGKIGELEHGVVQANLLRAIGFHRTYLLVAVVTDGRERTDANFAFRGPPLEMMRAIEAFPAQVKLDSDIGLGFVYVTQPVDKDIQWAGSIGIVIRRDAREREQSANLTAALSRMIE